MKDIPNSLIAGGLLCHSFLSFEISSDEHIFDTPPPSKMDCLLNCLTTYTCLYTH